jgi:hypothetical protein
MMRNGFVLAHPGTFPRPPLPSNDLMPGPLRGKDPGNLVMVGDGHPFLREFLRLQ